jgi:hypothetical protein
MFWISMAYHGAFEATDAFDMSTGALNIFVGGSGGALTAIGLRVWTSKSFDLHMRVILGLIAGAVSVSSGAFNMMSGEAFVVGALGGLLYAGVARIIERATCVDDPVDGIAVHLVCGAWSLFITSFVDKNEGVFHDGDGMLIGVQICGLIVSHLWTVVFGLIIYFLFQAFCSLTITKDLELLGFNYMQIDGCGYSLIDNVFVVPDESLTDPGKIYDDNPIKDPSRIFVTSANRTIHIVAIWSVLAALLIADIVLLIVFDGSCEQKIREWLIVMLIYFAAMILFLAVFEVIINCFKDEKAKEVRRNKWKDLYPCFIGLAIIVLGILSVVGSYWCWQEMRED